MDKQDSVISSETRILYASLLPEADNSSGSVSAAIVFGDKFIFCFLIKCKDVSVYQKPSTNSPSKHRITIATVPTFTAICKQI